MIQFLLKPEDAYLKDDDEGIDDNVIGIDDNVIDIEDGETFVIPEGYVGELILEEGEELEVHTIIAEMDLFLQFPIIVEDGSELSEGEYELKGGVLMKQSKK